MVWLGLYCNNRVCFLCFFFFFLFSLSFTMMHHDLEVEKKARRRTVNKAGSPDFGRNNKERKEEKHVHTYIHTTQWLRYSVSLDTRPEPKGIKK